MKLISLCLSRAKQMIPSKTTMAKQTPPNDSYLFKHILIAFVFKYTCEMYPSYLGCENTNT